MDEDKIKLRLEQYKEDVNKGLQDVLKNTSALDITRADRKFIRLAQKAFEDDSLYGNPGFRDIFNQAAEIFNQHYNLRLETISDLKKFGHEKRVNNGDVTERKPGYTPHEILGGENDIGQGEEEAHETMSHPD